MDFNKIQAEDGRWPRIDPNDSFAYLNMTFIKLEIQKKNIKNVNLKAVS